MTAQQSYVLCLAAAGLCGLGLFLYQSKQRGLTGPVRWLAPVFAVVWGGLGARAVFFFSRSGFLVPMYGWGHFFTFLPEGLAMGGAVGGFLLAGVLAARVTRQPRSAVMDAMAPAGVLALLVARLGEYFVTFGQGHYVENPAFHFFPLAVSNEWGEWYWAVFMLEALCALVILLWALRQRDLPAGHLWQRAVLYVLLSQVLCESLRSEALTWGFVRVQQLVSVLGTAAFTACYMRKAIKQRRALKALAVPLVVVLCGMGLLIGLEFALDRWQQTPKLLLYGAMAAILVAMGWAVGNLRKKAVAA